MRFGRLGEMKSHGSNSNGSDASENSNKKAPSRLVFLAGSLVMLALTLFGISYYHSWRCAHVKSSEEVEGNILGMRKRLAELESKNIFNALVIRNSLRLIQSRLRDKEKIEVDEISSRGEEEAVRVALVLAGAPDLHATEFDMDPKYRDADALFDAVDHVLGLSTEPANAHSHANSDRGGYDGEGGRGYDPDGFGFGSVSGLSDADMTSKCSEWRKMYRVVVGQSWGELPLDNQGMWVNYNCDSRVPMEV